MDKILKATVFNGELALTVLETTDIVNRAIEVHNLTPLTAAALGRTLTVGAFMSANLKNETDNLSIVVAGDGVGGKITVCGDGLLRMRGCIDEPSADLPLKTNGKLDVGGCVGHSGRITVTRSMGLKEPYSGSCGIVSGEIAQDFAAYYVYSEQIPTAIAVGVKIGKDLKCVGAGGVILQSLPFASEESLIKGENIINSLTDISSRIQKSGAEGVIKELFGCEDFSVFYPKYECRCSREKIAEMLVSLGKKEVEDIIRDEKEIKVGCQFCGKEYVFNGDDAAELFK